MKPAVRWAFVAVALVCFAADPKPVTARGANRDAQVEATVYTTPADLERVTGVALASPLIVVKVKISPKTEAALSVGPDDFTLISRKDGSRNPSLPINYLGFREREPQVKLLGLRLKDQEAKDPVEGLLYFSVEGKPRVKELALAYKNRAGQFVIDFGE